MYFSLITPDPSHRHEAFFERLHGPYADHQWLWQWFTAADGSTQHLARDFLFRRHEQDGQLRFYVVSARPPVPVLGHWQAQTKDYQPQLEVGSRLAFQLRVNPTVRHNRDDGKSKRHDVVMEARRKLKASSDAADLSPQALIHQVCHDWLHRRAEGLGFEVDPDHLLVEAYQQHTEPHGKSKNTLKFSTVELQGTLTVTDADAFTKALLQGIGPSKAFGCGLMLVKRA